MFIHMHAERPRFMGLILKDNTYLAHKSLPTQYQLDQESRF